MFSYLKFIFLNYLVSGLTNIEYIQKHNSFNSSYKLEKNKFINRIYENEFFKTNNKYIVNSNSSNQINYKLDVYKDSIDWRKKNKISSVKNQLDCGGCWAFSAVGAVESAWAIENNQLYNLSEQQLIDCSTQNNGCQGGSMDLAFNYIKNNGLCSNISYPYVAEDNKCNQNNCDSLINITDYKDVSQNNEKALMRALNHQPVSVAIQANKRSFQFYKSGIYSDPNCGFDLDHGVLLVGYGYDKLNDMDYWILKNSWGEDWGDNGYIKIMRNIDDSRGLCGIAMNPSVPII
tara:strand:+ start:6586 stop:7455 length:870 start_codon:yes stop_codon:yes gene_type:complete